MDAKKVIISDIDFIIGKNSEVTDDTHMDLVDEISDYVEEYHLAKSKEEAEERFKDAKGEFLRMNFTREMDLDLLFRIAAFGKDNK